MKLVSVRPDSILDLRLRISELDVRYMSMKLKMARLGLGLSIMSICVHCFGQVAAQRFRSQPPTVRGKRSESSSAK